MIYPLHSLLSQEHVGVNDLEWHEEMALYSTGLMVFTAAMSERKLPEYEENPVNIHAK